MGTLLWLNTEVLEKALIILVELYNVRWSGHGCSFVRLWYIYEIEDSTHWARSHLP